MVKTMRAVKIPCEDTIELHQVPIPEPQKGWVRIKMKASALCRSDLYRFHGQKVFEDTGDESFITPGHEPCGIVEKLGEGVDKVKEGDRVAIYLANRSIIYRRSRNTVYGMPENRCKRNKDCYNIRYRTDGNGRSTDCKSSGCTGDRI